MRMLIACVHNAPDDCSWARAMHRDDPDAEDDATLFRKAIGSVREFPATGAAVRAPRPAADTRMAERDDAEARSEFQRLLDEGDATCPDASLAYRQERVAPRLLQRLARGEFAVQAELDLHQAHPAQADAMLRSFLAECRDAGAGCVRLILALGARRDEGHAALKRQVERNLCQRSDVLAFHSAPATDGTDAVLVLLKPR
jgi:DNA-nicking Smr family endonuclease